MNTEKPLNVHDNAKGMFNTYTGMLVDLKNPTVDMIKTEDIAEALSRICRFGGHIERFYSVAEHSLLVAALAPRELKLEALSHDFTEAFVGDVIKPLKNLLGEPFKTIESNFENLIIQKYGLNKDKLADVKLYDSIALEMEHEAFKKGCVISQQNIEKRLKVLTNEVVTCTNAARLIIYFINYYSGGHK